MKEEDYPEHIKLARVKDYSQAIGEFLEWLPTKGYVVAEYFREEVSGKVQLLPAYKTIQDLLAEFFEIDQKKLEEERRHMLEAINARHAEDTFIDQQILKEAKASTAIDRDGDGQTIAVGPVTVGETIEKSD